ncbi:MAG: bifunctional phosphoribosylaminoimidazolecarboxamide formyltransferase/IMP cyclohydrolase [Actinobacteria bacterium]|nr:MAG: bifunctional phosphoribosylaminoimidazolecarboxamide formyltransferase/IMP cyclohydrolase [Actinomycetota bacterium]
MRALISAYEKTGLTGFARGLGELGFELVASGGTATYLEDAGLRVTRVEDVTEFPELLEGRVKTLHPRIHAGILARPALESDRAQLAEHAIEPFDLVCVSLYPFEQVVGRLEVEDEDVIEMIDIGGPSLLRGAAKNYASVTPVCRPKDYELLLSELRVNGGETSFETRRRLAGIAFATTAAYDSAIVSWFQKEEPFPDTISLAFDKSTELAYGENPHQRGAYYVLRGARSHLLSRVELVRGRPLSFNNLNDLSAARVLLSELEDPGCVIVKHANPCGVAVAATIEEAYSKALAADPVSAYGGVVVLNRAVSAALGEAIASQFVEVLHAPGYDEQAMEALAPKTSIRILNDLERRRSSAERWDFRHVLGGLLVQDPDREEQVREEMEVTCGELDDSIWDDLLFAWRVVKHVTSNAIVLAKGLQTVGIGAGQMSRVDAVRIAVDKARELGHDLEGAVLASDAFFPFPDGPGVALEAGVRALIQPGGSRRDGEVIETVARAGGAMVFTHRRHFRH